VLASFVIKIEYRRALQQNVIPASRPPAFPSFRPAKKLSISRFSAAFLPGSGKYLENDVTYSKQTTATFLPGATTAPHGLRQGTASAAPNASHPRSSIPNAPSNRELSTIQCRDNSRRRGVCANHSPLVTSHRPFLTGSAPQTESDVTHSKQTLEKILTGARTAIKEFGFSPNFDAESFAPAAKSLTQSRPYGRS
jgi:hypothetical protein